MEADFLSTSSPPKSSTAASPEETLADPRRRRFRLAQRPRREAERTAREIAVDYSRDCRQRGVSRARAAEILDVAPRTLRHWQCRPASAPSCVMRGRIPHACPVAVRNEVIRFLREVSGPGVGLAVLQALFRGVARCILADLLRRFRRVWRVRYRQHGQRLTWLVAGTVWAIDHSEARFTVDGVCEYLLAVRDLASRQQLAWQACRTQTADEAIAVLEALFALFGPPLVLKSDNGSAFIAEVFRRLLETHDIRILYSPARYPQYNGALERSNGTLKSLTQHCAVAEGHPHRWTTVDLEQARDLANTISRPWGHRGPTPQEAWAQRPTITIDQRRAFNERLAEHRLEARRDLGFDESQALTREHQAQLDRQALPQTLIELGYLRMTTVTQPAAKPKRVARDDIASRASVHIEKTCSTPALTAPLHLATETIEPRLAPALGNESDWAAPIPFAPCAESSLASVAVVAHCWASQLAATDGSRPAADAHATSQKTLATPVTRATIHGETESDGVSYTSLVPVLAHVEQENQSWLRRSIALILSLIKAAIISQ